MNPEEIKSCIQSQVVEERLGAVVEVLSTAELDVELFLQGMGDADWRVRKEVTQLFLQRADALDYVDQVLAQLGHPDNAGLRNAAIEILIGLGSRSLPQLGMRLSAADAEIRKFVVDILGEIGNPNCVSGLLPLLRDEDENVRFAVVETFGKLKARDAVADLIDLLQRADTGLQFVILDTLALIGDGVAAEKILPYADIALLRKSVFRCLGRLGNVGSIPVLLEGLADPLQKIREEALLSLAGLLRSMPPEPTLAVEPNSSIVALLKTYLRQDEITLKAAACQVLSLYPDPDNLQELIDLLAEENVQQEVISACRRFPGTSIAAVLNKLQLDDDSSLGVIYLAGELGHSAVAAKARPGLESGNPQLRYVCAQALGKIADAGSISPITALLTDAEREIRDIATTALGQIGNNSPEDVYAAVSPCLEQDSVDLKRRAVTILGNLPIALVENQLLLALKDVAADIRCEALSSLEGHCSRRLISGLTLALTDENADVRRLAAGALASCPAEQKNSVLQHAFEDGDPWVRMTALRSLGPGSEVDYQNILARGLADPNGLVVIAALEMLPQLLAEQTVEMATRVLLHADVEVVSTSIRILLACDQADRLLGHSERQVRLLTVKEMQKAPREDWIALFVDRLECEQDVAVCQALENAIRRGSSGS